MKLGTIYLITNKINGKQYVGQTARDMWTRFEEHCKKDNPSVIGTAIQKYGYLNFSLEEIEQVPLDKLDEREIYWIKHYDTYHKGYNQTHGGDPSNTSLKLVVAEKNLVIDSVEEFGRLVHEQVGWSSRSIVKKVREVLNSDKTFMEYHFESKPVDTPVSDDDVIRDWIQTLQIRFCGKHIYCFELEKEFETIAECARYLLDNDLYITTSKTPLQSVVTVIGKQLHGVTDYIDSVDGPLTFAFLPGSCKNCGSDTPYQKTKVYCPQLNMTFDSQTDAATYMVQNGIWQKIKVKTARLRISDIVNGHFPDYRGYTFEKIG